MKYLHYLGAVLAVAMLCSTASAAVFPAHHDLVIVQPADNCISLVEGALVSKFAVETHTCDAVLADLTGLCLMPIDDHAPTPKHVVLLIPADLDTSCISSRPSPPG